MSFSPFEDFLDFSTETAENISASHEEDDEETRSSSFSGEGVFETTVHSSRDDTDGSALSFNGGFSSFDSDTLQDFGSIVSLPPGTLAGLILRHHDRPDDTLENEDTEDRSMSTIVSSAPSGSHVPVPEISQDMWVVSPHPSFVPDSLQALSTVCTETLSYQRLMGDAASTSMQQDEVTVSTSSSRAGTLDRARTPAHEPAAFEAIANQLLRDVSRNNMNTGAWYSCFTEFDWDQLREMAKVVLAASGPAEKLLPLPPSPPVQDATILDRSSLLHGSYNAEELIPTSFVCPCCRDVLVGALALDCGCTVCFTCWESHCFIPPEIAEEQDGYVWVQEKRCKSCRRVVHSAIPCQALDVAVFQIVERLDTSCHDGKSQSMKLTYYSRLDAWRHIVLTRNNVTTQKQALQEDEMLARLIQEEEEVLWKKGGSQDRALHGSSHTLLIIGQAVVALLTATLSSMALNALVRRR